MARTIQTARKVTNQRPPRRQPTQPETAKTTKPVIAKQQTVRRAAEDRRQKCASKAPDSPQTSGPAKPPTQDTSELTASRTARATALRSSSLTTCIVCFEPKLYDEYPRRPVTRKCKHKPHACTSCLTISISTQFHTRMWDHIDCPECGLRLSPSDVDIHGDIDLVARYNGLNTHYQPCRHGKCKGGKTCDPQTESFIICSVRRCGKKTCTRCDEKWHEGLSCAEHQEKKVARGEKASEGWKNRKTKICPNETCGVRIEKDGGCSHMVCTKCNHQFCYACGASADPETGYPIHKIGCRG